MFWLTKTDNQNFEQWKKYGVNRAREDIWSVQNAYQQLYSNMSCNRKNDILMNKTHLDLGKYSLDHFGPVFDSKFEMHLKVNCLTLGNTSPYRFFFFFHVTYVSIEIETTKWLSSKIYTHIVKF